MECPGNKLISKISPKMANQLGWAHNYRYIRNVMKYDGVIYNVVGPRTGMYAKELALLEKYGYSLVVNLFN